MDKTVLILGGIAIVAAVVLLKKNAAAAPKPQPKVTISGPGGVSITGSAGGLSLNLGCDKSRASTCSIDGTCYDDNGCIQAANAK